MSIQAQTNLMNFRVPVELQNDFRILCKANHQTMSSQLVNMMKTFIKNERDEFYKTQSKISEFRDELKMGVQNENQKSGGDLPLDFVSTTHWGSNIDQNDF